MSVVYAIVRNSSVHQQIVMVFPVDPHMTEDPPENTNLTVDHRNTSAIENGSVVNFACSSAASPAPHTFKLLVDGREVHNSSSETAFSVAVTQSGVYSCEAVNTVGSQRSNNVTITVFGKCPHLQLCVFVRMIHSNPQFMKHEIILFQQRIVNERTR